MRSLGLAVGLLASLAAAACSSTSEVALSRVFIAAPWTGPERLTYDVTDRGVKGKGSCTLSLAPASEPGRSQLERSCAKDEFSDLGTVTVDSATLAPTAAKRTYSNAKTNETVTHTVVYEGAVARFRTEDGKKTRETTRDLPKASKGSPDPGWYDDESLLWLARGITLKAGYHAGYAHVINAGQPRILSVEVRVDAPETVKVPAGEFSAWKVRYQREDSIYYVWVDTQAPNRVVRARIEDVTYELTAVK